MTQLLVVRHAQASFASENYDQLSPLGHRQAALLAEWLAHEGAEPYAAVACGSMRRHNETWDAIDRAWRDAGRAPLEAACLPALDEFDHRAVLAAYSRRTGRGMGAETVDVSRPENVRAVYEYLRAALAMWSSGALDDALDEGFHAFKARVRSAAAELARLAAEHPRVLVVTSGGVKAQLAGVALGLADGRAAELALSVRNTGLSEFGVVGGRLVLASWNALPHLAAHELEAMRTHY